MQLDWDALTFVNLVLCGVILSFGIVSWRRTRVGTEIYVGIAFGLFGLSHLASLLGLAKTLNIALIAVRTAAYLLVTLALFQAAYRRK